MWRSKIMQTFKSLSRHFGIGGLVLILAVILAPGMVAKEKGQKTAVQLYKDEEGYRILSAMLDDAVKDWQLESADIYQFTVGASSLEVCSGIPFEFQAATADLLKKSERRTRFTAKFSLRYPYKLYPDQAATFFGITEVGFDPSRTM